MSVVKLVSISAFKTPDGASDEASVLFGSQGVRRCVESGKWRIEMGNVPVEAYGELPASGRSFYYGFKECLEKIRKWHQRALAFDPGIHFHVAYVNFEVGVLFKDMIGEADLEGLEFVSIRRLKVELQHELFDRVANLMGTAARRAGELSKIKDLARYPHLLTAALESPPFDRIKVFIYPFCSTQTQRIGYLGWVRPGARIVGIEQNPQVAWYATLGDPWLQHAQAQAMVSKCVASSQAIPP